MLPKQFPAYVFIKEGCDAPAYELPDANENQMLRMHIGLEQQSGLQAALVDCENILINKDLPALKQLTATDLENFIKKINKQIAQSLVILNNAGHEAGHYLAGATPVTKESGIPELPYQSSRAALKENTEIIKIKFGADAAKNYYEFVDLLNAGYDKVGTSFHEKTSLAAKYDLVKNAGYVDQIIKNSNLQHHPGYPYFCQTTRIIYTDQISKDMQENCETIIALIKGDADPIRIAAQALRTAYIHPFFDCNGRTARVLCNAFLMAYNIKAVDFNDEDNKDKFYQAIESLLENPEALYNYLKQTTQAENSMTSLFKNMLFEGMDYHGPFNSNLVQGKVHRFENRYEIRNESNKVLYTFDAKYYFNQATKYFKQKGTENISLYYAVRAGDFFAADKKNDEAARAYFAAAQLCFDLNNFDPAYLYAKKAQVLLAPIKQQVLEDFLNKLNFVDAAKPKTPTARTNLLDYYKVKSLDHAFRAAAANGKLRDIISLINQGANINSQGETSGKTALHMAYERIDREGVKEVINFLLQLPACRQDIKDNSGKCAIHCQPQGHATTQTSSIKTAQPK